VKKILLFLSVLFICGRVLCGFGPDEGEKVAEHAVKEAGEFVVEKAKEGVTLVDKKTRFQAVRIEVSNPAVVWMPEGRFITICDDLRDILNDKGKARFYSIGDSGWLQNDFISVVTNLNRRKSRSASMGAAFKKLLDFAENNVKKGEVSPRVAMVPIMKKKIKEYTPPGKLTGHQGQGETMGRLVEMNWRNKQYEDLLLKYRVIPRRGYNYSYFKRQLEDRYPEVQTIG